MAIIYKHVWLLWSYCKDWASICVLCGNEEHEISDTLS